MRFFSGLIIGIVLTIGAAYLHDANLSQAPGVTDPAAPTPGRIVNWETVHAIWNSDSEFLREQWNKIFH